jgi:hypothetical protein
MLSSDFESSSVERMKNQHWKSVHLAQEFGASVEERKRQCWEGAHFVKEFGASAEWKQHHSEGLFLV